MLYTLEKAKQKITYFIESKFYDLNTIREKNLKRHEKNMAKYDAKIMKRNKKAVDKAIKEAKYKYAIGNTYISVENGYLNADQRKAVIDTFVELGINFKYDETMGYIIVSDTEEPEEILE